MQTSKITFIFFAVAVCAAATVRAQDNPAQAAARAAIAQKLFEVSAQSSPAAIVPEPKSGLAAQPVGKTESAPVAAKWATTTSPTPIASGDNPAQAAARAAMAQKLFEIIPSSPAAAPTTSGMVAMPVAKAQLKAAAVTAKPATPPVSVAKKSAPASYAGKDLGLQPIMGPAVPVPPAKLEKLQALLAKYQADQVTPEEYQQQRAAILAAP